MAAKKNFKKMSDRELDQFISNNMQKEPKDRHEQTMDAIIEQGTREKDPSKKGVFTFVQEMLKKEFK